MFLYFLCFLSYFFLTLHNFYRNFPFFFSLEHVDYSICTLEFESRRESYFWVLEALDLYRPKVPTSLFFIQYLFLSFFLHFLWQFFDFIIPSFFLSVCLSVCLSFYLSLFLSSFLSSSPDIFKSFSLSFFYSNFFLQVYEMSRLNLSYTLLSKRKLLKLVEGKFMRGWDDPRMPTITVTSSILSIFCLYLLLYVVLMMNSAA